MATAKLRALARAGKTLDEIAEINGRETGWIPDTSTVSKKLNAMGEEPRKHRGELIPWHIRPEHVESKLRYMLSAESRRREGRELRRQDQCAARALDDLLFGRGIQLVVGYDPALGFYLTDRTEQDTDIIRVGSE
jgi:hypothetical protein